LVTVSNWSKPTAGLLTSVNSHRPNGVEAKRRLNLITISFTTGAYRAATENASGPYPFS
jgi:hypothetical protein